LRQRRDKPIKEQICKGTTIFGSNSHHASLSSALPTAVSGFEKSCWRYATRHTRWN